MPKVGIEPTLPEGNRILSPARLPVPPLRPKPDRSAGGLAGQGRFRSGAFPADFYFNFSVFLLCMVILGGMGSVWGVIAGGLILSYLDREGLATIGSKVQDAHPPVRADDGYGERARGDALPAASAA